MVFSTGAARVKQKCLFVDHLEELRWHIVRSVVAILILAVIIFFYHDWVFDNIIAGPINPNFVSYKALCDFSNWLHLGNSLCLQPINVTMQTTTFGGQFFSTFSIAFVGGFIGAFPYIFWEFWRFVKPALKPNELKNTRFIIVFVSFFFFLGAAFGYFILGPFTFNFLATFQISSLNMVQTRPTINDYLDNLTNLILGCGIAFRITGARICFNQDRSYNTIVPQALKKIRNSSHPDSCGNHYAQPRLD